MAGDYSINNIYQGGYSSFKPQYGDIFTGYRINPRTLGMTTDPRTAEIVKDASTKLNTGARHIEISAVTPEVFESIPNEQLKEMNRLSKLTGVSVSLHGPIVEPSGMGKESFSDTNRIAAERQMFSAVERAHLVNPEGNVPVTFHSSASLAEQIPIKDKEPEETIIINKETGSIHRLPLIERHFPGEEGKRDIKKEIDALNKEQWIRNLVQVESHAGFGREAIEHSMATNLLAEAEKKAGKHLTNEEKAMQFEFNRGVNYLNNSYNSLKQLYEMAYTNSSEEEKNKIKNFYNDIKEKAEKIKKNPNDINNAILMKEIVQDGLETLKEVQPRVFENLNDFSKEKTVETISNVALSSFKKFGDTSPILSIENPPVGGAFGRGGDLKDIVEKSRQQFVEKAVKEGVNEKEARKAADKLIGVTWDVGHINMLKKYGYENKDIIEETKKVAPFVKHIHLSDNFGLEHTELPMGMGNVPIGEILKNLGKEGFDAKKIIEAGNWWQHFKTPPFRETLEAFGSPIYGMEMTPYWNQTLGGQQDYYGGYGQMLPQTNYETFGAGFSRLPSELGGQRAGAEGSRMSGRGME
ncbi:Uncharacterised protein [uncultured archaeon]|nr:Uncharacterised protein [uncultured archaeon]